MLICCFDGFREHTLREGIIEKLNRNAYIINKILISERICKCYNLKGLTTSFQFNLRPVNIQLKKLASPV